MSKLKNTAKKEEPPAAALVPKLRFPEFRGAEGWKIAEVGEVFQVTRGEVLSMRLVNEVQTETMRYPVYSSQTKNNGLSGFYSEYLFEDAITWTTDGANAGDVNYRSGKFFCTNVCGVLLNAQGFANLCVAALINRVARKYVSYVGNPKLMNGVMSKISIPFPPLAEQQKIAECLSSVDEVIAAQGRKVDALKTHKKGLMQQLFPREGETQPRLRFPEFQNKGRWVKKPFSDLCDIKHGYAFEGEFFSNEGCYVLLTPGNFYEQGGYRDRGENQKYYTGEIPREYVLDSGDLLVAMTEQAAGLLGSPILVPESDKFLHNQRLGLVTKKPGVAWSNEFFFHVFNTQSVRKAIHRSASGMKVRHTSPTKIGDVVVSFPAMLSEQQRIAECLRNLDDRVAAETEKLAVLKTHKRGLMQKLFPSSKEVAA